jgi:hypothetical protein
LCFSDVSRNKARWSSGVSHARATSLSGLALNRLPQRRGVAFVLLGCVEERGEMFQRRIPYACGELVWLALKSIPSPARAVIRWMSVKASRNLAHVHRAPGRNSRCRPRTRCKAGKSSRVWSNSSPLAPLPRSGPSREARQRSYSDNRYSHTHRKGSHIHNPNRDNPRRPSPSQGPHRPAGTAETGSTVDSDRFSSTGNRARLGNRV